MVHFPTRGILILTFLKQFNIEDSKNMRTFRVEWLFTYFQARATVQHELYLNPGLWHWNQWLYPWAIALDWELAHCKPQTLLSFHLSSFSRTFSRIMLSCIGKYFELGYHMYNLLNFLRHFPKLCCPWDYWIFPDFLLLFLRHFTLYCQGKYMFKH